MRSKILITAGFVSALALGALPALAQSSGNNSTSLLERRESQAQNQSNAYFQQQQAIQQQQQAIQVYKKPSLNDLSTSDTPSDAVPPSVEELQNIKKEDTSVKKEEEKGVAFDLRQEAVKEAAVSYGARGGLAWRTYHIRQELETYAAQLDKVYDFRQLLIPAPSGLLIEPPIVSESLNALLIQDGGQSAAVSDRFYNIVHNAKIVSAPRSWRTYLEREWGTIDPPPDILRPENDKERKMWAELVTKGWQAGIDQANDIFQDDLASLQADFQGMVRYRALLAQGMISPPYALQVDRGVTGNGDEMRVGDRAVQITGVPELITGSDQWQPASR